MTSVRSSNAGSIYQESIVGSDSADDRVLDPLRGSTPTAYRLSMSGSHCNWEIHGNGVNQKMVDLTNVVADVNGRQIGSISMACDMYMSGMRDCPPKTYTLQTLVDRDNLYHGHLDSYIQSNKLMYILADQELLSRALLEMRTYGRSTNPEIDHQVNALILFKNAAVAVKMSSFNSETAIEVYDPSVTNVIFKVTVASSDLESTKCLDYDSTPMLLDESAWRTNSDEFIRTAIHDFIINGPVFGRHFKGGEACAVLSSGSLLQPATSDSRKYIPTNYNELASQGLTSQTGDPVELAIWAMRLNDPEQVRYALSLARTQETPFNDNEHIRELVECTINELKAIKEEDLRVKFANIIRDELSKPGAWSQDGKAKLIQICEKLETNNKPILVNQRIEPLGMQPRKRSARKNRSLETDIVNGNTENKQTSRPTPQTISETQKLRHSLPPIGGTSPVQMHSLQASMDQFSASVGISSRELRLLAGGVGLASSAFILSTMGISASSLLASGAMLVVTIGLLRAANEGNRSAHDVF